MLRQDLTPAPSGPRETDNGKRSASSASSTTDRAIQRLDIQQSLDLLEELILESPRVPFSRRTLVDEDRLLEQLDQVRLRLPSAFQEALQVIQQQNAIVQDAERYAQEIIQAAEQEAAHRLDDLKIVQQAEAQAQQIKQQLHQECDDMKAQALSEIEKWQQVAQRHWEQTKQQTEADCQAFKDDADLYAAQVLQRVERQLSDMLSIVHNGQQTLQTHRDAGTGVVSAVPSSAQRPLPQSEGSRPGRSRRRPE